MRDDRLIKLAISVARLSQHPRFRMGAVLAKKGTILSTGVNKVKTHPLQANPKTKKKGHAIHAELDSIIGVPRHQLHGATIYVARVLANGTRGLAEPCEACNTLLKEVGIRKVIWTTPNTYQHRFEGRKL